MSFFTALQFYRPGPPPKITGDDLAKPGDWYWGVAETG